MSKLERKTILVTGGSRGIGAAISMAFADRGARIIVVYRSDENAATKLLSSLKGDRHRVYQCDISVPNQIVALFNQLRSEYDRLDVVVNNAGVGRHHPIDESSFVDWQSSWQDIINTNLIGPSNVCYHAAQMMTKQEDGHIINIGSRGGYRGEPLMPAYGASKAGLHSMTQSLAFQLSKYNVFVGAIAPGFVLTDMSKSRLDGLSGEEIKNQSPMKRVARPDEVAAAVISMSRANIWMTGAVWDVNGASYFR